MPPHSPCITPRLAIRKTCVRLTWLKRGRHEKVFSFDRIFTFGWSFAIPCGGNAAKGRAKFLSCARRAVARRLTTGCDIPEGFRAQDWLGCRSPVDTRQAVLASWVQGSGVLQWDGRKLLRFQLSQKRTLPFCRDGRCVSGLSLGTRLVDISRSCQGALLFRCSADSLRPLPSHHGHPSRSMTYGAVKL